MSKEPGSNGLDCWCQGCLPSRPLSDHCDRRSHVNAPTIVSSLGVCRIGRTEEAKECWSGLRSDYRLHESMLSQIVELGYSLPQT